MFKQPWVVGVLTLVVASAAITGIVIFIPFGANVKSTTTKTTKPVDQDDPLATIRDTVRKERDVTGCKAVVAQLNVHLGRNSENKLPPLSAAERDALTKRLNLTDNELKEVSADDFPGLDAYYLDECLLFQDAIRSLNLSFADTTDAAKLDRARLGLAWAMRQVWRREQPSRPAPTGFVLRRGSGTDLERAAVALAMLQMLGLDGCLIGGKADTAPPTFWAVGVRLAKEIFLFDLRSGAPVAGPAGKGIATLAQVRSNPNLIKALPGVAVPSDPKQSLASSDVHLAPPLSALAPRMRFLQGVLAGTPPIQLAVDLPGLLERFAQTGEKVSLWNPPKDFATPVRALAYFISAAEGGLDRSEGAQRNLQQFQFALIPWSRMPPQIRDEAISGEPGNRLKERFAAGFVTFVLEPGKPRDLVLRGRFDEANGLLVERLTNLDRFEAQFAGETNVEEDAKLWVDELRSAYAAMVLAERAAPGSSAAGAARLRVEELQKRAQKITLLIDRAAGEPMAADATFLLALCKHEQAERQTRQNRTPEERRDAWKSAAGWWNNYLGKFGSQPWVAPGQVLHARTLQAHAHAQAQSKEIN